MNHAQAAATIRKQIAELEKMAQEHEAQVVTEQADEWPKKGDCYWFLTQAGDIFCVNFNDFDIDEDRKSIGNCFRTEAEAIRRCEALKVQAELRRMPGRCAPPDGSRDIWCIRYSGEDNEFTADWFRGVGRWQFAIAGVWFETEESAHQALDTIGTERLRLWLADYLQTPITEGGAV